MNLARALRLLLVGGSVLVLLDAGAEAVAAYRPRTPPAACGPGLKVMSANLLMVNPDPGPLAAEIMAEDADLLLLQEYSTRWLEALTAAGARSRWPHAVEVVRDDSFGSAIWSKTPFVASELIELTDLPQTWARLPLGSGEIEVYNIHTLPPRTLEYMYWHRQAMDLILGLMESSPSPALFGGDFNSASRSGFSRKARRLVDDAWELAGSGPGYSWPNGVFHLPPLRLDHLWMSRDLTVTDIRLGVGAHSDHRPLVAHLAPRAGGRLCPPAKAEE